MVRKPTYEELEQQVRQLEQDEIERKRVEERIRFLSSAVEQSSEGIAIAGMKGNLIHVNHAWIEMHGYESSEELVGRNLSIFHNPEQLINEVEPFNAIVMEKGCCKGEVWHIRKDGKPFPTLMTSSLLKDESGNPTAISGIAKDITDIKRAEEKLKLERDTLQGLMDGLATTRIGVDVVGVDYKILQQSKLLIDIFGDLTGKLCYENYMGLDIPCDPCPMAVAIKSGKVERAEMTGSDGRNYEIFSAPLPSPDGSIDKAIEVVLDITERKRMEDELLRAQKLESMGILAGGIAHDFNNILATIIGNVAMARMQVSPEDKIFDLLCEAETASTRAQTLTKQLLTFAKGGMPLKETASIKDILKESSSFVLRGSKSNCEFSIAEDLCPADFDIGQMRQVINNIVINANQAMPKGGTIRVAAENLIIEDRHGLPVKPGRYIKISIKDQGVGIAENHFLNIFDPYFTTKQEGRGLGLATAHSIIRKHYGHIIMESKLGVGTTFHIYLPASDKAVPEKEEVRLITGQGRILVMDDEASLRKMVGRMLRDLGYDSEFAKDGAEAFQKYKEAQDSEKPYDAVILDLTVPGEMGGKEAIKKLLEIDPGVKAIVFSGYSDDPVLSNFQEYGFKGMIPKPFESQSLSKVLHEMLQGEKE
jgi:PAS domain S-box-containing protein